MADTDDLRKAIIDALPGRQADIARVVQRRSTTVRGHLVSLLADGLVERVDGVYRVPVIPPPLTDYEWPLHFDDPAKRLFVSRVVTFQTLGIWDDEDRDILERYVTSQQVARLARERIARRVRDTPSDPAEAYTTKGSQGQLVQHPDLKTARDAERDAQDYEVKLIARQDSRDLGDTNAGGTGDQAGL